jgi:hypothetical protein
VGDQGNLVLLVFAVTLVDAGRCGESVTFAHLEAAPWCAALDY